MPSNVSIHRTIAEPLEYQTEEPGELEYNMLVENSGLGTLPERKLALAVLENAIIEYQTAVKRGRECEAESWFASDDTSHVFHFVSICHIFDIDPGYIRRGLALWARRCGKLYRRPRQWKTPTKVKPKKAVAQSRKQMYTEKVLKATAEPKPKTESARRK